MPKQLGRPMLTAVLDRRAVPAQRLASTAANAAVAMAPAELRAPAQDECGGLFGALGDRGEGRHDHSTDGVAEAVLPFGTSA